MIFHSLDHYLESIKKINTLEDLQELRQKYFGKQGEFTQALKALSGLTSEKRKEEGEKIHFLKKMILEVLGKKEDDLREFALNAQLLKERVDVTLPGISVQKGFFHPINEVLWDVVKIFQQMGFSWMDGPEIETTFYNFDALNVTEGHPARAEQDTFYLPKGVLRTQTSPVQIRTMEQNRPPLKMISPGRVYRSDHDQTHTPMFHQIEGLVVSREANMAELKGVLQMFLERFFLKPISLRFRPSFFPFTEPSCEVDIGYRKEGGEIILDGDSHWLEILGCGMVHQKILMRCDICPKTYQGYAFGMGLERLTMLRYGVQDIREFYKNHQTWLSNLSVQNFLNTFLSQKINNENLDCIQEQDKI
ncbi:phenylalanine--tRNA ligase alpha subunit [Holospora obtusa F1]|uniref:Phenylalanine--tRNA ligase alpha subunit n=1 Tax=Holospora obtusa F1 TaxID=1399147 RepID=W6TF45_HOLOB|nr:phenylalanine--tRNA ligase subunit alpha [Holospora obtusa]ETZ07581.1 phenylalanine--tRNA ligase alpha subunit [Holospora obtusa F1]